MRNSIKNLFLITCLFFALPSVAEVKNHKNDLIRLRDIAPQIEHDMRYATANNFLYKIVTGYYDTDCYLTSSTALSLLNVENELNKKGYGLVVFDCFRSQESINEFVAWVNANNLDQIDSRYYPNSKRQNLIQDGYISKTSGHLTGKSIDLGLRKLNLPKNTPDIKNCTDTGPDDLSGNLVNMGTSFDCFDEMSHTFSKNISKIAQKNRKYLLETMNSNGFKNYNREWWHYTFVGKNQK